MKHHDPDAAPDYPDLRRAVTLEPAPMPPMYPERYLVRSAKGRYLGRVMLHRDGDWLAAAYRSTAPPTSHATKEQAVRWVLAQPGE